MFINSMTSIIRAQNSLISKIGTLIGLNKKEDFPSSDKELEELAIEKFPVKVRTDLVVDTCDEDLTEKHKLVLQSFLDNWDDNKKLIRANAYKAFKNMMKSSEDLDPIFSSITCESDIDDFFTIYSIVLTEDRVMELHGGALWDDEHGFQTSWGELNI